MTYCILYFTWQKGIRLWQLARPLSIVERLFRRTAHCILYILNFLICQKRLCVYGKFFFLLFSNSYDMDIAQCIEVNTTPALAEIHVEAERPQQPLRQAVFVAPSGSCQFENPLQHADGDFVVHHKKFEGLVTPFDLPIECFPEFESMLDEDPGCVDTVNIMLRGAVAQSMASNYKSVVTRFHAYCMERGYGFPKFEASSVLRFVKDCHAEGFGLAFF